MRLIDSIVDDAADMTALRRDIHAHPELGFEERRTADLVARLLTEWGIPIHRGLGTTGVVGIVKGHDGPRAVGLRADIDALPITEANAFAHRSTHTGRMHACGHDGHTTMLLAAAKELARRRDFAGTVYLIFQPAEEGGGGGREMIKDGLFERFPMEAVFGAHNWPSLPAGRFALRPGPVMAATNEFWITLAGRGAHGAMPHLGIDPVPAACALVQGFQTIVTRNRRPIDPAVISVTTIHTGEATNVIPERCAISGTVRAFHTDVIDLVERRMREMTDALAGAYGCTSTFEFRRNYPATVNHAAETAFAKDVFAGIVGAENVVDFEPTMGAEDFSYLLQERPGCYFIIGSGRDPAGGDPGLHHPQYDFNDEIIPLGATAWVELAERWLGR